MKQHSVVNDQFRIWLHDSLVGIYSVHLYVEAAYNCIAATMTSSDLLTCACALKTAFEM
jgi:hypothetical protein